MERMDGTALIRILQPCVNKFDTTKYLRYECNYNYNHNVRFNYWKR